MEYELLLVRWIDARKMNTTLLLEPFKAQKPVLTWTIGFGYEREDAVVLAQDFYPLEEGDFPGDEGFRQIVIIPKGCILEVRRLDEARTG